MTPFIPLGPAYLAASLREAGFDPRIVDLTFFDKRKVNVEQVREAVRITKDIGYNIILYIIIGLPGSTVDAEARTLDVLQEMDVSFTFSICTPYPGAPLWKEVEDDLKDVSWDRYD